MSVIFHILVLFGCLWWLAKSNRSYSVLLGIVGTFLGGTIISIMLAFVIEHDYLDGLTHLLLAGGSTFLFWMLSILILVLQEDKPLSSSIVYKIVILSLVLILPVLIYLLFSSMTFKIGG